MKVETPFLKRRGGVPFWRGERKCAELLEECYGKAAERAAKILDAAAGAPPDLKARRHCGIISGNPSRADGQG